MRTGALLSTEMRNDGGSPKSNYKVSLTNQPFIRLSQLNASEQNRLDFPAIFILCLVCVSLPEEGDAASSSSSPSSSSSSSTYTMAALFDKTPPVTSLPRSNDMTDGVVMVIKPRQQHSEMLFRLFFKMHVGGFLCIA